MGIGEVIALIGSISPVVLAVATIYASNRVVSVKLEEMQKQFDRLETKVDKHNNFMERIATLEQKDAAQWKWIDEMKEKVL